MAGEKRGVIVVHGIGDQRPGATVKEFADAYARQVGGQSLSPGEIYWHEEEGEVLALDVVGQDPTRGKTRFPSFRQHVAADGDNLVFSEVYWADLSPTPKGVVGTVQAFLWVLFGLRHVIREALTGTGLPIFRRALLAVLRWLSASVTWLIFGPISGINLFLFVTVLIVAATFGLSDVLRLETFVGTYLLPGFTLENFVNENAVVLLAALGLLSALTGLYAWRPLRRRGWPRRTLFWWVAFSLLMVGVPGLVKSQFEGLTLIFLRSINPDSPVLALDAAGFGGLVVELILAIWMVAGGLLALQYVLSVAAWLTIRSYRRAIELAYGSTFLIATFYWIIITIVWMFTIQNVSSNGFVKSVAEQLVRRGLDPAGFSWLAFAVIVCVFIIVGFNRWRWRRRHRTADAYDPTQPISRLIASPLLFHVLNLASLIGMVLIANVTFGVFGSVGYLFDWDAAAVTDQGHGMLGRVLSVLDVDHLQGFVQEISRATLVFTGFLILAIAFLLSPIQTGLGLLIDITNHFRLGKRPFFASLRHDGWGRAVKRGVMPACNDVFPLRARIIERIRIVTEDLIAQERVTSISVVSHSQGTVFAILALAKYPDMFGGRPVQLITLGSPYSHLYQHYFPGRYSKDPGDEISQIGRWVNIFRTDDFVGTEINGNGEFPENVPVPPRGHTGYWQDKDVLAAIQEKAPL